MIVGTAEVRHLAFEDDCGARRGTAEEGCLDRESALVVVDGRHDIRRTGTEQRYSFDQFFFRHLFQDFDSDRHVGLRRRFKPRLRAG